LIDDDDDDDDDDEMTLNDVIALILRFSPNLIALLANYVTMVESRHNVGKMLSPSSSLRP